MDEFKKIKPVFDQFLKDYPNLHPEEIVKDVAEKKEAYYLLLENQNEQHEKLFDIKKEQKEESNKYKVQLDEMVNRLSRIEDEYKDRIKKYETEISNLKGELEHANVYKNENIKMTSMLFKLYNMLIERFKMDRHMNFNEPNLQVAETDFKCNLFDNVEIMNYIKTMITLSSEEKSADVLREVIAYSNMMLRLYTNEEKKDKFRPKKSFLAIKRTFEMFIAEKIKHQEIITSEQDKVHYQEMEINKLRKLVKEKETQVLNLEKKYDEQFKEKMHNVNVKRNSAIMNRKSRVSIDLGVSTGGMTTTNNNQRLNIVGLENMENDIIPKYQNIFTNVNIHQRKHSVENRPVTATNIKSTNSIETNVIIISIILIL